MPALSPSDNWQTNFIARRRLKPIPKPASYIPPKLFKASLAGHDSNCFATFLVGLFGEEIALELISRYFIGTSKHWNGATVFWQIDLAGKVRAGKIMLYNPDSGKRVKEPFSHVNWVHRVLGLTEYELRQCFFGEHLLRDKTKPVAIVESEKTACIANVYLPQFIWLATGSKEGLTEEKCRVLKGRTVMLFPDLNGFENWTSKAQEFSHLATFVVSDLLERKATEEERAAGLDLADYLIRFDYRAFAVEEASPEPAQANFVKVEAFEPEPPPFIPTFKLKWEPPKRENWEAEITEWENWFAGIAVPSQPVKLATWATVINIPLFIHSHLETLKANNGNRTFSPFLDRLRAFKHVLTTN